MCNQRSINAIFQLAASPSEPLVLGIWNLSDGNKLTGLNLYYFTYSRMKLHLRLGSLISICVIWKILDSVVSCFSPSLDPGRMFKLDQDPGIFDEINPLKADSIWSSTDNNWSKDDNSCSMGTGIVLKRIVRKLFNHVDGLQPSELDDEFIYHSVITYNDYLNMLRYLDDKQLNCASLHGLDSLLSKFITNAQVKRPSQISFFKSTLMNSFNIQNIINFPSNLPLGDLKHGQFTPITLIILVVILTIWAVKAVGYSQFRAAVIGIAIIGFIQYYMQEESMRFNDQREKILRCSEPSLIASLLEKLGIDYYNCRSLTNEGSQLYQTNIALTSVGFLSELLLSPVVKTWSKMGEGSKKFLDSFTGISSFLAPIFLVILYAFVVCAAIFIVKHFISCFLFRPKTTKSNKSSALKGSGNRVSAVTSPRRRSIEHQRSGSSVKKRNK